MKKAGILTWHYYSNFGSALQAYALLQTIRGMHYDVRIINYRNPKYNQKMSLGKRKMRVFLGNTIGRLPVYRCERFSYAFLRFQEKYLHQTKLVQDEAALAKIATEFECIVCGSDQIWAPNVFNPVYMANCVDDPKIKKISYAASVGLDDIPDSLVPVYRDCLRRFAAISVREESGRELLHERCNIDSTVVLDPTLLLTSAQYGTIERKPALGPKSRYVFCYLLNDTHHYTESIRKFAEAEHLEIVGISANATDNSWMKNMKAMGPQEFLWMIHHADYVATDSYHGAIFSIVFQKQFTLFQRFANDDPVNQNSRIVQLAQWFDLGSRIITGEEEIVRESIQYEQIRNKMIKAKNLSIMFLAEALK